MEFSLSTILSMEWLARNDYRLVLPTGNNFAAHRTRIIRRMWEQLDHGASKNSISKYLESYSSNTNWNSITKMIKADFQPVKLLKGNYLMLYKADRKKVNETEFVLGIEMRTTGKLIGQLITCIDQVDLSNIEHEEKQGIDIKRVIDKRNEALQLHQLPEPDLKDLADGERLAMAVCEDFATGLMTINEVCGKYGISYLKWMELCQRSSYIREQYERAIQMAHWFNHSLQLTGVDKLLSESIQRGQFRRTVTHFVKKYIPGRLEPMKVETSSKEEVRDYTPGELAAMKALLLKSITFNFGQRNEFDNMTDDELYQIIREADADSGVDKPL
jgi:hypothetical protein